MGAVDLVVQVESPGAVSRGLQRIGRAGHQVGEPSRGKVFPKHRADLLEAATVVPRMEAGLVESTRYPRNPVDVLAQQIVAMCALDEWTVDEVKQLVRRSAPFHEVTDTILHEVLDLLAGRYPSEEFAELRPRIVWDRALGVVRGRRGAQRLAVTSGGTIPDRGLYGVFLPDGKRVGELDEEMVYESRVGETFLLGASTWRIEDITPERVVVTPAPGLPGKMPFWHGDGPGRPLELGRAVGETTRTLRELPKAEALDRLRTVHHLDERAAANLVAYIDDQVAEGAVPDDRTIVVERFRDEIGDWRVCILSPFGARVHAPWAMVLQARLTERWGTPVELMWSDDGIVLRLPEAYDELPLDELLVDPEDVDDLIIAHLPTTALFASRFRECAARALLLPRRRPDRRTPLWQQRQKAADLLTVAARHPRFPILYETTREILTDVFDVPALRDLLGDLRARRVRVVPVDTPKASPFAQSLLFGWIAVYMYEGDAPLAERRAAALALDKDLLAELLGADELRDLLDADVLAEVEASLQRVDGVAPPATPTSSTTSSAPSGPSPSTSSWRGPTPVTEGRRSSRAGSTPSWPSGAPSASAWPARSGWRRPRTPLGCATPWAAPCPSGCRRPSPTRSTGPCSTWWPASPAPTGPSSPARSPPATGSTSRGRRGRWESWRPTAASSSASSAPGASSASGATPRSCGGSAAGRWRPCAARSSRSRPMRWPASCRPGRASACPGAASTGWPRCSAVLQGAPIPASVLEADVLPARMDRYRPSDLDALAASGDIVWVGAGAIGAGDGRVRLAFRGEVGLLSPSPTPTPSPTAPSTTSCAPTWPRPGPRSGPSSRRRWPPPGWRTTTIGPCWSRCGTWSGPARSPTTPWRRCAPSSPAARARPARGRRPGPVGPVPVGSPGRAPRQPPGGGRWWPPCATPSPRRARRPWPGPSSSSSATAC